MYATATSERASKGQGGNRYLITDFQAGEEREHVAEVRIEPDRLLDRFHLIVSVLGVVELTKVITLKGKKQKTT